jgi:hypothetical protein
MAWSSSPAIAPRSCGARYRRRRPRARPWTRPRSGHHSRPPGRVAPSRYQDRPTRDAGRASSPSRRPRGHRYRLLRRLPPNHWLPRPRPRRRRSTPTGGRLQSGRTRLRPPRRRPRPPVTHGPPRLRPAARVVPRLGRATTAASPGPPWLRGSRPRPAVTPGQLRCHRPLLPAFRANRPHTEVTPGRHPASRASRQRRAAMPGRFPFRPRLAVRSVPRVSRQRRVAMCGGRRLGLAVRSVPGRGHRPVTRGPLPVARTASRRRFPLSRRLLTLGRSPFRPRLRPAAGSVRRRAGRPRPAATGGRPWPVRMVGQALRRRAPIPAVRRGPPRLGHRLACGLGPEGLQSQGRTAPAASAGERERRRRPVAQATVGDTRPSREGTVRARARPRPTVEMPMHGPTSLAGLTTR